VDEVDRVANQESLIDLLACPKCHGALARVARPEGFVCESCRLFYAVDDGLPNMLIDDAKPWPLGSGEQAG
jgi:uncharacterized protein YbaR (Trm112 family)